MSFLKGIIKAVVDYDPEPEPAHRNAPGLTEPSAEERGKKMPGADQ